MGTRLKMCLKIVVTVPVFLGKHESEEMNREARNSPYS